MISAFSRETEVSQCKFHGKQFCPVQRFVPTQFAPCHCCYMRLAPLCLCPFLSLSLLIPLILTWAATLRLRLLYFRMFRQWHGCYGYSSRLPLWVFFTTAAMGILHDCCYGYSSRLPLWVFFTTAAMGILHDCCYGYYSRLKKHLL